MRVLGIALLLIAALFFLAPARASPEMSIEENFCLNENTITAALDAIAVDNDVGPDLLLDAKSGAVAHYDERIDSDEPAEAPHCATLSMNYAVNTAQDVAGIGFDSVNRYIRSDSDSFSLYGDDDTSSNGPAENVRRDLRMI